MKTKFIILVSLISFLSAKGQDNDNITGKFYITNIDVVVSELNILNPTIVTDSKYIARRGTKFTAYEIKENNLLVIKFWKYENDVQSTLKTNDNNELYNYISKETNDRYFIMNLHDFNKKTSEFNGTNHSFIWGFSTLPIKLRFKNDNAPFQYETGFSLGVNAGYEFQFQSKNKQSIGFLLGVGISAVNITPETVNDYIDKSITTGAFTPSLALVYTYESFQIGVFTGLDIIPGELGQNWDYKNKPWLGLGLGFTIFQKNKTDTTTEQSQ
jgi:hypothetical protein